MGPQTNCSFIQQDHSHQQHLNHLNYTHLNHNGHSTLPPTCQALRHRPRRRFQPSRLRRRSCPSVRRHLPTRQGRRQQGRVLQEQGSCLRGCELGFIPCWFSHSNIRCCCPHQCRRYPQLQGIRLPRQLDLHGFLLSISRLRRC